MTPFIRFYEGKVLQIAIGCRVEVKEEYYQIYIKVEYGGWSVELQNVPYVTKLEDNLLSLGKIEETGSQIIINEGAANIVNNGDTIIKTKKTNSLYFFETVQLVSTAAKISSLDTWQRRFGNTCVEAIKKIPRLEIEGEDKMECTTCIQGKMRRWTFPKGTTENTNKTLELIHTDIVKTMSPSSKSKAQYFVTFLGDYLNYIVAKK